MKRQLLLIIAFWMVCTIQIYSQTATFSFSALPEKEVKAYFSEGDQPDSLEVRLDRYGTGSIRFPEGYRGFVQAVVNESSLVEFIIGKEDSLIESTDPRPSNQNIQFKASEENSFFSSVIGRKRQNQQQRVWLDAGRELYPQDKSLNKILTKNIDRNEQERVAIEREIATSPLYAARFLEFMDFADNLFQAENQQDTAKIAYVKDYLQNRMDWEALYTAGQLWTMVQNYTLSMFNKENPGRSLVETQESYAAFIAPLFAKQEEPVRSAMLRSIIHECESFSWSLAENQIASYILENNIVVDSDDFKIARLMQGFKARVGEQPPPIEGIIDLRNSILLFFETGCGNCAREITELRDNYSRLTTQGYQVISISADMDQASYEAQANTFPWSLKFCDYQGFAGKAFMDYGIMATPTIYVIDANGIIQGRYARLQDTGLL